MKKDEKNRDRKYDHADSEKINRIEEELVVDKEKVETGKVILHKKVFEEKVPLELSVEEEHIEVEVKKIGQVVEEPGPAIREEGDSTIYSVYREVFVKQTILEEEVWVTKKRSSKPFHTSEKLRREVIDVERVPVNTKILDEDREETGGTYSDQSYNLDQERQRRDISNSEPYNEDDQNDYDPKSSQPERRRDASLEESTNGDRPRQGENSSTREIYDDMPARDHQMDRPESGKRNSRNDEFQDRDNLREREESSPREGSSSGSANRNTRDRDYREKKAAPKRRYQGDSQGYNEQGDVTGYDRLKE